MIVDLDKERAKKLLYEKFGRRIQRITFGKRRKMDNTMGVKILFRDGEIFSYSYLTDIV